MSKPSMYRLAIREEGEHTIAAYFAEVGTMENAKLIGTMSREVGQMFPDVFEQFKKAMSTAMAHMVEALEGHIVKEFNERPAPPAEKQRKPNG